MSIVRYHQRPRDEEARGWIDLMAPAVELAKAVANTDFVPKTLRGNPAAITAAILYGDEVGIGPMQALARISVIDGRPTLAAETQRALILAAGHELWVEEATVTRVTVAGRRRDSEQTVRFTWTLDDAKRAGIGGRNAWRAYPRQMLLARATAELARAIFADAIGGLAATEELEAEPETEAEAEARGTAVPPAPASATRRRRKGTVTAATSAPAPSAEAPEPPPVPGDVVPETGLREDLVLPPLRSEPETEAPPEPEPEPEPTGDDRPPTAPMKTRLNVLVGKLRDPGHLTTEQIYYAIGTLRRKTPTEIALAVGGVDDAGKLHWGPLRDSLTRGEARQLSEWFEAKEERLALSEPPADEPEPPPLPGDDWP